MKRTILVVLVIAAVTSTSASAEIFLPGMQPKEAGIEFVKVQQCRMCHANTRNGEADPFLSWEGSMMAQAARDPVFRASVTVANQDFPGAGEFCFRCHAPRGWLEDRSTPADGSDLNAEDMMGVSCDVCHRLIDPLSDEAKKLIKDVPPSYGNAMMVADPDNRVRGPYGNGKGAMPHKTGKSDYHATSNLCATCHNISNPVFAKDVKTQPVHAFGHVERTYSEWLLSDYAKMGEKGTCQSCHYDRVEGGGQASRLGSLHRDYFVQHGPVGGSTWVQDVTAMLWPAADIDSKALALAKARARKLLKEAATVEVNITSDNKARIRVTNLTGHKLPSGYPEGRRAWLNVRFLDSAGRTVGEIGKFGPKEETILGERVTVNTLLDEDQARIYEALPGMSQTVADKFKKTPGKSFHFVLNDIMTKDTRIPPKGFNNAAFAEHLSAPVGAKYADGQYWDELDYALPPKTAKVEATLMYQSVISDYIKFLAEENRTDDWGKRLYQGWLKTDQCPPEIMVEAQAAVSAR